MNLVDELASVYRDSIVVEESNDMWSAEKAVQSQIRTITKKLFKNAEQGKLEIRLVTSTVFPAVVQYFKDEGFIMWENSETILIRIPLQHN